MKKRILAILIITLMFIALIPSTAFAATSGTCGSNAKWKLENGTLTIYGSGAMKDYTAKSLPPWNKNYEEIDCIIIDEGITSTGEYAFSGLKYVTKAVFSEGVKVISSYSFRNCEWLEEMHFPLSLKTIEKDAFAGCTRLYTTYYAGDRVEFGEIDIRDGNRYIILGDIYYTCEHEYPEDIVESSPATCHRPAQYYCGRCYQYFLSDEIPAYEKEVFPGTAPTCTEPGYTDRIRCLTCGYDSQSREEIPPTGHSFGEWKTENGGTKTRKCTACDALEVSGTCGKNAVWSIVDDTLTISGSGAMTNYSETKAPQWYTEDFIVQIKKIVVEEGITHIGDHAFNGCLFVENIEIPVTVKTIGEFPFLGTPSLKHIFVDYKNKYFVHNGVEGTLKDRAETEIIWIPARFDDTSIWIGDEIVSIPYEALVQAKNLKYFDVSSENPVFGDSSSSYLVDKSETTILFFARGSESASVRAYVEKVASYSGAYWDELEELNLGNFHEDQVIEENAFAYCPNLLKVTIDSGIGKIKKNAFLGCDKLREIKFEGTYEEYQSFLKRVEKEGNEAIFNCEYVSFDSCRTGCANSVYSVVSEATCTEGKYESEYCPDCKSRSLYISSGPLGHSEVVIPAKDPTCVQAGYTSGKKCERCNEIFEGMESIPALGHDEIPVPAVEPTCTSTGLTEGKKCSRCDEIFVAQQVVPKADHTGEWTITKPATETEKGIKTRTCTVCGEVETVEYSLYKKGDVNKDGKVDAKDATQILRFANGKSSVLDTMDEAEKPAIGDVNADDTVDAKDATQILRYVNGKSSVFDSFAE